MFSVVEGAISVVDCKVHTFKMFEAKRHFIIATAIELNRDKVSGLVWNILLTCNKQHLFGNYLTSGWETAAANFSFCASYKIFCQL